MIKVEEFYKQWEDLDKFDKKAPKFDYSDLLEFAERYAHEVTGKALIAFKKGEIRVTESETEEGIVTFWWADKELKHK
tara:strand:+ start:1801 stop:2034 length:234 start_codon:yes stop_codon:yes gene_type:complete